jgi:hypothetical protein
MFSEKYLRKKISKSFHTLLTTLLSVDPDLLVIIVCYLVVTETIQKHWVDDLLMFE